MKKPKIRFKGYQEDWEQRKFADFTWDAGKRNKEDLDLEPYAITNEHGFIRQRDAHDDFGYMKDTDRKAYNIVQPNSFAYNPARINVGSIGYYKGVENVIVSSLYEVFQTDNYVNDRFLWHWLKSDEFPRWIEKLQEGSVRLYFYYDKLCECQLYMPSLEEQEKIATFLDDLDHLITLHHRKYMKYADLSVFDWEQRKLVDLVDRVTRKNQDLVSELPLTISAQYGLIDQNEFFDKRVASKDVSGYYLIENGEFAYNKSTSTDAPWGAIKRLDRYKNGVLSTLYIVFGIKENNPVDSDFLVSYYSTNLWHKGIHEIAAEGARNHGLLNIAPADFFETKLMIPQDIEEQKKIGKYFEELERLITLHQRKCEETKTLKKYMLQKMFPQNGHSVPEIRFSGFTEDWEQRKFADFTWDAGKRNKEDLDLEPYAITNEHGFIRQRDAHDDFGYMKDTDRKAYNIVQPNSFAYNPARINVGSIGYYKGVENVIVSSLYEVFQTDNYVNDRFLWHWLKSDEFPRWIEKLQEGSVRLYFYYDKLCECQLYMPSLEEQEKIATFLDDLDHLITLHQHKCEELQNIKKFMLKNMFI